MDKTKKLNPQQQLIPSANVIANTRPNKTVISEITAHTEFYIRGGEIASDHAHVVRI